MEVAKVTSKGQITIPISIRRRLDINEGDKVLFIYKSEGVMMVNPNTLQGGADGDVVAEAETEIAAEAVAATKKRKTAKPSAPVTEPAAAAVAAEVAEPEEDVEAESISADEAANEEAVRPVPPPLDEPEKPDKQVGGFDLSTLLDDIRSIGSNI